MISYLRQSNRNNWEIIFYNLRKKVLRLTGDYQIEVTRIKKDPTDKQRGYYFCVILPMINDYLREQGNYYSDITQLHDDIKEAIQERFGLYKEVENKITGKIDKRPISVSNSKGNREDTRKYIEAVLCFAAQDFGLDIPDPYVNK